MTLNFRSQGGAVYGARRQSRRARELARDWFGGFGRHLVLCEAQNPSGNFMKDLELEVSSIVVTVLPVLGKLATPTEPTNSGFGDTLPSGRPTPPDTDSARGIRAPRVASSITTVPRSTSSWP
jgi:hypothetical protein